MLPFHKVASISPTADDSTQPLTFTWLLGHGSYQRICLTYWLLTSTVYLLLLTLHAYAVFKGITPAEGAVAGWVSAVVGMSFFYVALRSGWSKRFEDPAMTAQQMVFAFAMLAVAYAVNARLRGILMSVSPLVLIFSAFTLPPRRCRQLGVLSVLTQGIALGISSIYFPTDEPLVFQIWTLAFVVVVFTMTAEMAARLSMIRLKQRTQKKALLQALERNEKLARHDELTNLPNRRYAMEILEYEERRAQRQPVGPCVCMLDIDHFKRVNDQHGHDAGDDLLRLLASYAMAELRGPDVLARWGGEEFLLVMPETTLDEGMQVLERLRYRLSQSDLWQGREHLRVTFSSGIASLESQESIFSTVSRADAALYRAKQNGRNCTVRA